MKLTSEVIFDALHQDLTFQLWHSLSAKGLPNISSEGLWWRGLEGRVRRRQKWTIKMDSPWCCPPRVSTWAISGEIFSPSNGDFGGLFDGPPMHFMFRKSASLISATHSGVDFPGFWASRETGIFPEFSGFPGNFPGNLCTLWFQLFKHPFVPYNLYTNAMPIWHHLVMTRQK